MACGRWPVAGAGNPSPPGRQGLAEGVFESLHTPSENHKTSINKGFQELWPDACFSPFQTQTAAEFGMANLIDQAFGTHGTALQLRAERAQLLAANLANADTPGFKARDIDFQAALASAQGAAAPLVTTQANHVAGLDAGASPTALYRTPLQPSLDGNTVDVATEQAAFGENSNRYLASLTFLNGRIRGLMTALRGE